VIDRDVRTADEYDWRDDAFKCWQLAIREMRLAGIRAGLYAPLPDRLEEVEAAAASRSQIRES
jgi:hypothetical protein